MDEHLVDSHTAANDMIETMEEVRKLRAWLTFSLPPALRAEVDERLRQKERRLCDLLIGWYDLGGGIALEPPEEIPRSLDSGDAADPNTVEAARDGATEVGDADADGSEAASTAGLEDVGDIEDGGDGGDVEDVEDVEDVGKVENVVAPVIGPPAPPPDSPEPPAVAPPPTPYSPPADPAALAQLQQKGIGAHRTPGAPPADTRALLLEIVKVAKQPGARGTAGLLGTMDRWPLLPGATQVLLLELSVARLRTTQSNPPTEAERDAFRPLADYSKRERPGIAHGLAMHHRPRGATWADDAHALFEQFAELARPPRPTPVVLIDTAERALEDLRQLLDEHEAAPADARVEAEERIRARLVAAFPSAQGSGAGGSLKRDDPRLVQLLKEHVSLLEGDSFKKTRKCIRKLEDADVAEEARAGADALPEGWWQQHGAVTEGKRGLLVGGDPRQPQWDRLRDTFKFASLDWAGTEYKTKDLERARDRITSGGLDVVLVLHRWTGHNADAIIQPACRQHDVRFIPVQRSYGITGIRMAIEQYGGA